MWLSFHRESREWLTSEIFIRLSQIKQNLIFLVQQIVTTNAKYSSQSTNKNLLKVLFNITTQSQT
jgi:hypothetical protein